MLICNIFGFVAKRALVQWRLWNKKSKNF